MASFLSQIASDLVSPVNIFLQQISPERDQSMSIKWLNQDLEERKKILTPQTNPLYRQSGLVGFVLLPGDQPPDTFGLTQFNKQSLLSFHSVYRVTHEGSQEKDGV